MCDTCDTEGVAPLEIPLPTDRGSLKAWHIPSSMISRVRDLWERKSWAEMWTVLPFPPLQDPFPLEIDIKALIYTVKMVFRIQTACTHFFHMFSLKHNV